MINKPVQVKIVAQTIYEDGIKWWGLSVFHADNWILDFNDFTDFTVDFNPKIMIEWARDMEEITEGLMGKYDSSTMTHLV